MKKIKSIIIMLLVLVCIFSLASCKQEEPDKWPETGLALQLPKPESGILKATYDGNNAFLASVDQFDKTEYEKYSSACQQKGFTIDMVQSAYGYTAFNEEGYKLTLNYYSDSSMQIQLDPPIEIGDLKWPIGSAGKAVPEPSSKKGKINWEHEDSFLVYVGNTTLSDYNKYVDKCIDAGFVVDYTKGDKYYRAKNSDDYSIDIEYEGFNIMRIRVDKELDSSESNESISESSIQEESINESSLTSEVSVSSNEKSRVDSSQLSESSENAIIRTEVKEAIDSYEEFVNQYCEFMAKYDSSDVEMLKEYTNFLQKEIEVSKEFEDIEDMELNDAELDYYIEVQLRCSKKMMDIAKTMETSQDNSQSENSILDSSEPAESKDNTTIRTEVKEAIDSYEEFIDQYCEFMQKYDSSDMEMLNEYMKFLQKEVEASKKFEAIEDMDLNDAESDYYTDVQLRCTKKMLDVANAM